MQYYLRDHLGNVRVVLNETGQAQQVTEYHAFGKAVSQTGNNWQTNRYLYNGKELQPETEYLDYGARQYDPTLGRFMSIDRFTEKYESLSGYQYAANNPVLLIDVNGDSLNVNSDGKVYSYGYTEKGGHGFYDSKGSIYSRNDPFMN